LDLVDKGLVTDQMVLTVGYDVENLNDPKRSRAYKGPVTTDYYGRRVPKHAHGTANLGCRTSSARKIMDAVLALYDRIVDPNLLVRRINLTANHVAGESSVSRENPVEQLDLFTDYAAEEKKRAEERAALERERRRQQAILSIKKKYGKNAILKGMDLEEGATTLDRNRQIGGHRA
ncbi:MAG: DNA methylase, partial [Oscillospiraceae bacterium]